MLHLYYDVPYPCTLLEFPCIICKTSFYCTVCWNLKICKSLLQLIRPFFKVGTLNLHIINTACCNPKQNHSQYCTENYAKANHSCKTSVMRLQPSCIIKENLKNNWFWRASSYHSGGISFVLYSKQNQKYIFPTKPATLEMYKSLENSENTLLTQECRWHEHPLFSPVDKTVSHTH